MADKRISQLIERTDIANNDVLPIVASGATTTNKVTVSTLQDWMQDNLDVGVTSVGLSVPSAFTVSGSPVTTSGNITISGAGTTAQYIRGDGSLADFPSSLGGGGASVSYYLNGSVNQGTIGGVAYRELSKSPILGSGTDFTINADGYIASFITDAGDPSLLEIPGGNWNFETYFQASSGGGTPSFYVELYKVSSGGTATLIATSSGSPELIAFGTNTTPYFSSLAVPTTTLALTDRLAIRYYVTHSGRTITLHTENNTLCQIITTFTTGLTALNGLTAQVQNFATGTSGTDFNISSASTTHTFNLPDASASNRGAVTTGSQVFGGVKTFANGLSLPAVGGSNQVTRIVNIGTLHEGSANLNQIGFNSANNIYFGKGLSNGGVLQWTNSAVRYYTLPDADGTLALASQIPTNPVGGTGTTNQIPKFTGSSTIGNSNLSDDGSAVTCSTELRVLGALNGTTASLTSTGTHLSLIRNTFNTFTFAVGTASGISGLLIGNNTAGTTPLIINQSNGAVTLAGALNGTSATFTGNVQGDFFTVGTTAATSGGIRLGTQVAIRARNVANTNNIPLIESTSSDNVSIASGGASVGIGGTNTDSLFTINGTAGTSHQRFREGSTTVGLIGGANGIITGHNGKLAVRGESGLVLSGQGNSADMIISSTGAATFSSSVTGRNFVINEASANRGGLYPYNLVLGSGTDYSTGIYSEGEIFLASGGSATKRFTMASTGAATFSSSVTTGGQVTIKAGNGNQLYLNNNGERYTQITFDNNTSGTSKAGIWYDNTSNVFDLFANTGGSIRMLTGGVFGSPALTLASTGAATFSNNVTSSGFLSTTDRLYIPGNRPISDWFSSSLTAGYSVANNYGWVNGAGNLILGTDGVERMRITSGGNVGIGTTTPTTYSLAGRHLEVNDAGGGYAFIHNNTTAVKSFYAVNNSEGSAGLYTFSDHFLKFGTNNSEKVRITSVGYLKASNTGSYISVGANYHEFSNSNGGTVTMYLRSHGSVNGSGILSTTPLADTSEYFFGGNSDGVARVRIYTNGNIQNQNNSYGSLSDIKLKENIEDATPKLDDLMKVKVRNYNLIGDDKKQIGVIAQELEEVFPAMIDESEDFEEVEVPQVDEEGNEVLNEEGEVVTENKRVSKGTTTKSVKYSVFVPMLIKAIQEQQEQIKSLTEQVEALKSQING
jgi:hypothetical protein